MAEGVHTPALKTVLFFDAWFRQSSNNDGLPAGRCLEISGASGSGKSEVLYEILLECIMPATFNGLALGGQLKEAFVMDIDGHFSTSRVVQRLQHRIAIALQQSPPDYEAVSQQQYKDLEAACLRRVILCYPKDVCQTLSALHTAHRLVTSKASSLRLVVVDGVLAEQNHTTPLRTFLDGFVRLCRQLLNTNRVSLIFTRALTFHSDALAAQNHLAHHASKYSTKFDQLPDYKVVLRRDPPGLPPSQPGCEDVPFDFIGCTTRAPSFSGRFHNWSCDSMGYVQSFNFRITHGGLAEPDHTAPSIRSTASTGVT